MERLLFWFGLLQANHTVAFFPFAAFAQEFDALEALQNGFTFSGTGSGDFKTVVL